ncbi:2-C-methyl-D-erythritol 4-phosphate cytidylyltransferase [Dysgonomonas sp. 25]|uniref:2-C-methyl-D-erythritol 4-phosphate cytidylyltransferase n=1 Tax=Dysgonomonas sp. 25 TaxID=2302933 RepID=UPI0013D13BC0|nr:2-C-methyl-D-erythritol 4-phosphate cytidylyltransferase [Dysgonomonas sp. 25]NDV68051.1 2-C-methyl-D-erythritol 4-phosphate cytidylyltransferase [Dysgonomonas sp. 25]
MKATNNIIIVAGGKGLRMGGELPKQFIPIGGKPILMHTIEAFYRFDKEIHIILVLPASHRDYWAELCCEYHFVVPHVITLGGETRFHSVQNGLQLVEKGIVGVHDGARPFASKELIKRCFDEAQEYEVVIPVVDSTDSLREVMPDGKSRIIDRTKIKSVQTPQVFTVDVLKKAYQAAYNETFTDDASVVEALGKDIHLVQGEPTNIKVTTPIDLKISELILSSQ